MKYLKRFNENIDYVNTSAMESDIQDILLELKDEEFEAFFNFTTRKLDGKNVWCKVEISKENKFDYSQIEETIERIKYYMTENNFYVYDFSPYVQLDLRRQFNRFGNGRWMNRAYYFEIKFKNILSTNELKATTYRSAGDKFTKMGHKRRGAELLDYATQVELKEKSQKLRQAQDENKEYGLFDITMTRGYGNNKRDVFSGKFYLQMCLESDWFKDQLCDWIYEGMDWSLGLAMEFAIIPSDDETLKMLETSEDGDIVYFRNNSMWGDDYRYWTNRLWLTLCDKGGVPHCRAGAGGFEDRDSFTFHFNSRSESMKFRNLLANTLEGKSNWGSYNGRTISDQLKSTIIMDEEDWRTKLMRKFLPDREDEYDINNPDTWPKNPFTEDTYKGSIEAVKRMSVNGLYRD